MIYYLNQKQNNTAKSKQSFICEVDTIKIINLLTDISSVKSTQKMNNSKINLIKETINLTSNTLKDAYKNMIVTEVKLSNIKSTADTIKERKSFVKDLYLTVMEHKQCNKLY